ncbi:MAG: septum formation initiator family protein [Bacteroidota bacterium]
MAASTKKLFAWIVIVVIVLGVFTFLFFNENGVWKFFKLKNELTKLDQEITKAEVRLKALEAEIDSLKTSRIKIEKVAREKFNMMRKNEKAFRIEDD